MKSSSLLFPVELASTDVLENRFVDCYSLKPNTSDDKSVELALVHITHRHVESIEKQVLFVHDAYQSHWQWLSDEFQSCIDHALGLGHAVWLLDWRSHGSSKKNKAPQLNTVTEMAQFDLPSVVAFIEEKTSLATSIVAKGYGAQMVLEALALQLPVHKLVLLNAAPVFGVRRYWMPGSKAITKLSLLTKPWVAGAGPEMESRGFMVDQLKRHGFSYLWRRTWYREVQASIKQVRSNILWLCSEADSIRHARRYSNEPRLKRLKEDDFPKYLKDWLQTL